MKRNKINVGDSIPSFRLQNQDENWIKVSPDDNRKRVIYFYPKNNTPKCSEQACSFRDWQDEFLEQGYEVIGISADSPSSHLKFKARYNLNFTLLSDPKGTVRKLFGATTFAGLLPARKTFLIDTQGRIAVIHDALFEGKEHVEAMLKVLKSDRYRLNKEG